MEYVIGFAIGTVLSWIAFVVIVPIAEKLAQFSFPPWPQTLWKLAVVAAVVNAVMIALAPLHPLLSFGAGMGVFWVLMVKWFYVDVYRAIIFVIVGFVVTYLLFYRIMLALVRGLGS
jgi:predicted lysophospholipase L1 biosynthesis ABC-type transport system permease subunit